MSDPSNQVPGQLPAAGWHPDPHGSGLRWWDGAAWTEHVHDPEAQPAPTPQGRRLPPTRTLILFGVLAVVIVVAAIVLLSGGSDDSTAPETSASPAPIGAPPSEAAKMDLLAKERVHSAQIAIETFATEHGGSYLGATPAALEEIEPTLQSANVELGEVGAAYYTIAVTSESSNLFSVKKEAGGPLVFECSPAGEGDCPPGGIWG